MDYGGEVCGLNKKNLKYRLKVAYSSLLKPIAELLSVTCHIRSPVI